MDGEGGEDCELACFHLRASSIFTHELLLTLVGAVQLRGGEKAGKGVCRVLAAKSWRVVQITKSRSVSAMNVITAKAVEK
jgi:hypothetical protein